MKRVVERVAAAGPEVGEVPADLNDDVPEETAAPAPARRANRKAQALTDARGNKAAEEREYTPPADPDAHTQGRESLKEILARADGAKKPKAPTRAQVEAMKSEADEPEVPPENDNPDPDAHPPEEGDDTETQGDGETEAEGGDGKGTPPQETTAETVEILTPEQRRELASKLTENRRARELEAELKRAQADVERYKNAKSARELLTAAGRDPAVALEELLVGGDQPAAEAAGDMSPRERELAGRVAALEKLIQDSQRQQTTAQMQAARGAAVKKIETLITAEHFPMVAAMGAFEDVMTEGEGLYDASQEDGKGYGLRVMQVAADAVEQRLRAKYPTIAAKLAAGGGEAPAKPAATATPPKPKPTVGSRSAPSTKAADTSSDLPLDDSRHVAVRERFFGRRHTA